MKITIADQIKLYNVPEVIKNALLAELRFVNPKYTEAKKQGYWTGNIEKYITNFNILLDGAIQMPRGMLSFILKLAKSIEEEIEINDERTRFLQNFEIDSSNIKLRPYQMKGISDLVGNGDNGLLVSKAGSGKTIMGISLIPLLGQPTLWITHTTPLINQVLERIHQFLPSLINDDLGYIGSGKWKVGNVVTVAMVQTLVRSSEKLNTLKNRFGLIVVDEVHHAPSTTFTTVLKQLNPYYLYGLTATPYRKDGLEKLMFQTVGELCSVIPIEEIKKSGGILTPTVIKRRISSPTTILTDDFQKIINGLVYDSYRNQTIANDVLIEARNNNTCIVITDRKIHAELLYTIIKKGWPKTTIATGNYSKKYVREQIDKLEKKEVTVLIATGALLGEGFDYAPLNRCFLGLPFRNVVKIEQIIGRIQRPAIGKKDAILYDYVDDHGLLKHQFFNEGVKGCRYNVYKNIGATIVEKK